jgi:hypothetical protein
MKEFDEVNSVQEYLSIMQLLQQRSLAQIHRFGNVRPALLFRGQKADVPLVSSIGQVIEKNNISFPLTFERNRLRIARSVIGATSRYSDWDLIALCQHHGIATRFLDWSSNSLVALWFAVSTRNYKVKRKPVVWVLETNDRDFSISEEERVPIPEKKGSETVIFTPDLIDSRIYAQDSYLMRQIYEKVNPDFDKLRIRSVDENPLFKDRLFRIPITENEVKREMILEELEKYGYTYDRLIPDSIWSVVKECCDNLIKDYVSE